MCLDFSPAHSRFDNGFCFLLTRQGQDTTAAAVSWCLYLIGGHPEVQERVSEELNRIFGTSDRPITMADILQLKYLECCIKEALRLYPSVAMYGRTLSEDAVIRIFINLFKHPVLLF